ncbi:hypothetical protein CMU11_12675 [Elizabethkingia anophelis]|uniref:Uncharacterized protein n=1 Tax=Elizabethkingia anophelis TaxID=1117645 RepID=A0A494J531_9FLAO|nr:hypothetical protein [Elizabethkingia anophelis]AQX50632.1 hypothetical protein AYC66_08075 [Elizabethkingia anophelis]MDV3645066.1 hypothetical protein [Elizabethkingia anophelis]MDV3684787.1 hypothetical protein [Elizabethkingia anophelis]MDV3737961.1 hypothetical protein [Elizabethkingia anophelis]MDV3916984.1 hypothetical protein [Elizabethkingia anophelis]
MKKRNNLIGKKAKVNCTYEDLRSIGIPSDCKHCFPDKEVKIHEYDSDHDSLGDMYTINDGSGYPPEFFYTVPLKWLQIIE